MLLSHLILFGFVYPDARDEVPAWVLRDVVGRLQEELAAAPEADHVCQGTLLSWRQYLPDVEQQGYGDGRLVQGYLTRDEIDRWTAAFRNA